MSEILIALCWATALCLSKCGGALKAPGMSDNDPVFLFLSKAVLSEPEPNRVLDMYEACGCERGVIQNHT